MYLYRISAHNKLGKNRKPRKIIFLLNNHVLRIGILLPRNLFDASTTLILCLQNVDFAGSVRLRDDLFDDLDSSFSSYAGNAERTGQSSRQRYSCFSLSNIKQWIVWIVVTQFCQFLFLFNVAVFVSMVLYPQWFQFDASVESYKWLSAFATIIDKPFI